MDDILKQILNKLDSMNNKIITMDNKVTSMENKVTSMENKVTLMDNKVTSMDNKIDSIEKTQALIQTQIKEHGEILSALKTASEFHKADVDNLTHQTAQMSGDVKTIKNAVTKGEEAYKYVQEIKNIFTHKG